MRKQFLVFCTGSLVFIALTFAARPSAATENDTDQGCSGSNVERCRNENTTGCKAVIGTLCAEAAIAEMRADRKVSAKQFLNRACRLEIGQSCFLLGKMEQDSGDAQRAKVYFLTGCQFDSEKSCEMLLELAGQEAKAGESFDDQMASVDKPSDDPASGPACADAESCHKIGWENQNSGKKRVAVGFYRQACAKGLAKSCNNAAWLIETDKTMADDADSLYRKACELGHSKACARLARVTTP